MIVILTLYYLLGEVMPLLDQKKSLAKDLRRSCMRNRLAATTLSAHYIAPPFSVFDSRQGYWQARKRQWMSLGIQSELGRGANLLVTGDGSVMNGTSDWAGNRGSKVSPGGQPRPAMRLGKDGRTRLRDGYGRPTDSAAQGTGTSIFDPVLCELIYRWFCPKGGRIIDPFAGGSVRGVTAAVLGAYYTGIDLSEAQVHANRIQAKSIVPDNLPNWVTGDSLDVRKLAGNVKYDLIFSCPPYFDLEQYSDHPADLSNMSPDEFLAVYRKIVKRVVSLLKDDRFACFVVGNVRGRDHYYRNLPLETVHAFEDAGCRLYNDAIMLTAIGSLPLRVRRQFDSNRKLGMTHQSVLVFCKGDYASAAAASIGSETNG